MIYMQDFSKFCTIITELQNSNVQLKLFGKMEESFSGGYTGFDTPPNNALCIHIAALTSIGTFYCNSNIRLNDVDATANAKEKFEALDVFPSDISYIRESGTIKLN